MPHPLADIVRRFNDLHIFRRQYLQQDGRLTVHSGEDFLILETVDDLRHITNADDAAPCILANDDFTKIFFIVSQVPGPQQHVTRFCPDAT